jgi:hypothetical protein
MEALQQTSSLAHAFDPPHAIGGKEFSLSLFGGMDGILFG